MRDRDAGDGGPPEVIIRDQEGAGYRGQHPDLVTGVREVRQDGRLDLADDLERARAHDGNARTRTACGCQLPATGQAYRRCGVMITASGNSTANWDAVPKFAPMRSAY